MPRKMIPTDPSLAEIDGLPFLKVSADDGIDGATVKTRPTEMMNVMMAR